MKHGNIKTMLSLMVLGAAILACGIPSTEPGPAEAPIDDLQEISDEGGGAPPDAPSIQHEVIPVDFPSSQSGQAGDFDSSKVLENNSLIGGDRFTFNRFERPFNANTMDVYFSQLDIVNTQVYQDDTWVYGKLTLKELGASSSQNEKYALELDVTVNGKGDWFILTNKPESTEWTVTGVKVYQDANRDVGGELPALTDKNPVQGDGFETLIFDQGQGDDPDTAWVRISPNDPNTIEFAVKKSVLGNPAKFMINMWAGTSLLDPALFDINDRFTHEQAGAADKGLEFFYPIKEVAEIDNSCRMAVGFQPTGNEAGICPVPQKEQQGAPVPPGTSCPPGTFLFCNNGVCFCFPIFIIEFPTPIPPVP
ncbi:MAG: hypothetical protein QY332_20535 [Anaerolineales bacterium]|nr:MAG: hypothetical protein QY332_20535 [Anaerolineales bacterium]